jgi:hypothetical protein
MGDFKGNFFCRVNVSEYGTYAPQKLFNFTLRANNTFYRRKNSYSFALMETLVPERIENVRINASITKNYSHEMAFVELMLPKELEAASDDLIFDIRWKAKEDNENNWAILNQKLKGKHLQKSFTIPLNYSNTIYQFKVRMKSKLSKDNENMWSPFVEKIFKTLPRLPEMIPEVCLNCFNKMDNGNIYLYWKDIPKFYQNSNEFKYIVQILNQKGEELVKVKQRKPSFLISNNINETSIEARIYSSNDLGTTKNFSTIFVAIGPNEILIHIKKELVNDTQYKLSWKLKESVFNAESFTVFFCQQKNELPNTCEGSIDFLELALNQTEFIFETHFSYQFGVAANRANNTATGFEWARCTASQPNGKKQ